MRFTWKELGATATAIEGTSADESQRARLTKKADGWFAKVLCGITRAEQVSGPFLDVGQAKRWAQRAADDLRAEQPVPTSEDRIVYLVVTEPGGVDGLDRTAKGGEVLLATFDKAQAVAKIGRDTRYRLETKVVDVAKAREEVLRKLSALDRLLLATAPSAVRQAAVENDLFEENRG